MKRTKIKKTGAALLSLALAALLAAATPVCTYAETVNAVTADSNGAYVNGAEARVAAETVTADSNASAEEAAGDAASDAEDAIGLSTAGADGTPEWDSAGSVSSDSAFITLSSNETPEDDEALSEDTLSENEADAEDSVSSNDAVCDSVSFNELPYGLPGMGEDYILSQEMMDRKYQLIENAVLETLRGMTEGEDYEERKLVLGTDDPEFAKQVAAAYGAEFGACEYGIATMYLPKDGISVLEAVEVGMDLAYNIPPVEPNYYIPLEEPDVTEEFTNIPMEINAAGTQVASRQSYDTIYGTYANDPFLNPKDSHYQWFHDMIHTYPAWGVTTGSTAIKVAVIDTGVSKHADFAHLTRYNYLGTSTPADDSSHGTNVAGIIGAAMNNGKGGAGVAPGVSIMGYPVFIEGSSGKVTGDSEAIIKAIKDASDKGADIINMSLGGPVYDSSFAAAVNYAYKKGVTVVCSAGNGFSNSMNYPGTYPHVICVAAADYSGKKTGFSNTGSWVDVAAPGLNMWSTGNGATESSHVNPTPSNTTTYYEWVEMSGTSQATPVVAGACALYMSAKGHVDPDTMEKVIKRSVSKKGAGLGAGIIDLSKMFASDRTAPTVATTNGKSTLEAGQSIQITEASKVVSSTGITGRGGKILYTINGKSPSILNGNIVNGTLYSGPLSYASLIGKYPAGSKITVRAAAVSGLGVLTKVKTVTFTMGSREPTSLTINAPLKKSGSSYVINAGGTATLRAVAAPAGALSKCTWAIDRERTTATLTGAKINAKTGALTTKAGQTGTIYVVCTSTVKNTVKGEAAIVVQNSPLAAGMKLDKSKMTVYAGETAVLNVKAVTWPKSVKNPPALGALPFTWTSSNTKVATVSYAAATPYQATIRGVSKGTAKITCMLQDGSGRKAVCTVTVGQHPTSITIKGPYALAKGAGGKYTATVYPSNANNKAVTWSLVLPDAFKDKVTINAKTGAVKVAADAPTGTFSVKAVSKDVNSVSRTFAVNVIAAATNEVRLAPSSYNPKAAIPAAAANGSLKSIRLYSVDQPETSSYNETVVRLTPSLLDKKKGAVSNVMLQWTTSNPKVVTIAGANTSVTSASAQNIYALKPGTAKITCKALDGSGKSATVTVKVITPASGMAVTSTGSQVYIAAGKSAKTTATPGSLHGKPSISKAKWDFVLLNSSGTALTDITELCKKNGRVKVKNGKVTVSSKMASMAGYRVRVTATTTDGTEYSDSTVYAISRKGSYISISGFITSRGYTYRNTNLSLPIYSNCSGAFTVKSSSPKVASAYYQQGYLILTTYKKRGTAKITVRATDGSGKSKTVYVEVR